VKVSVIVPVYNDCRIESCISSLLIQDYPRELYEIIVVDNNSVTLIKEIIYRFPVRYLREERQGSYFARNRGLEIATGDIAAFIDADCIADPAWLNNLVHGFEDQRVGGIGGMILKLHPKTWVQAAAEDLAEQQISSQSLPFFQAPYIVTANAAYSMSILRELGGFDTQFQSGGDVDLAWRLQRSGYQIVTACDAIVYHDARESVKGYFRQYFNYAVGHTLLFKKHRQVTGRKFFVNTYPLWGLILLLFAVLPAMPVQRVFGRPHTTRMRVAFLSFVKYIALAFGNIYGAIKYRIPYL
jgi:cellulose synthase/poly-beta-1,6-N-acetylglucosamine synthase-like glycosyltransferase